MIRVLITGCSMHSYELIQALKDNYDIEEIYVVGINCDELSLLRKGLNAGYIVPRITEREYVPTLIEICKKEHIDIVFPFITAELQIAAGYRQELEKIGTKVSVASRFALNITGDKGSLAAKFHDFMPAQTIISEAWEVKKFAKEIGYPETKFCCKLPDKCGGLGFCIVDEEKGKNLSLFNKFGLNRYVTLDMMEILAENYLSNGKEERIVLQEYEEGTDYSMCILAENGEVLYGLGFEAYLMAFGSAMFARIQQNDQAARIAKTVTQYACLDGNACFDFIKKPDGTVKLLEVNPRVSATLPFIAKAGLNLPYLRCRQLLGSDVRNMTFDINYKLRMSKNYSSEYFE